MKLEKNKRYFNIAVYVFLTWVAILIATCIILRLHEAWQIFWTGVGYIYTLLEPLILGLVIAYLLAPLVRFYEKRCRKLVLPRWFHSRRNRKKEKEKRWHTRTVPTLLAFITFGLVIGLFILVIKLNIKQVAGSFSLASFKQSMNGYISYFEDMLQNFSRFTSFMGISAAPNDILAWLYGKINQLISGVYQNMLNSIAALGLHTMNWLLAFVIAFYLLQDSMRLCAIAELVGKKLFKGRYLGVRHIFTQADTVFAGYIRGELLDSVIIVILTSGALTLVQLDFAIIIGIISGIFNLIPYFGPVVGFVLAIIIGLLDPSPVKAIYGGIAILIIQQIDGWFIVPNIVGDSVKLHPVVVLLVILIGGNLFGLLGMLLAVPVTGFIRVLLITYIPDIFGKISDGK